MELIEKYESVLNGWSQNEKRKVHYRSVRNLIIHLPSLTENFYSIKIKLNEYLELIESGREDINDNSESLFENYIMTIGEKYREIGFIRIVQLRYLFVYSFMADSLLYIPFFKFPYPIVSSLVFLNYLIRQKRLYKANKVYGLFY